MNFKEKWFLSLSNVLTFYHSYRNRSFFLYKLHSEFFNRKVETSSLHQKRGEGRNDKKHDYQYTHDRPFPFETAVEDPLGKISSKTSIFVPLFHVKSGTCKGSTLIPNNNNNKNQIFDIFN